MGGEVAAVHRVYVSQLGSGQAAVLVGAGQDSADIDVYDLIALLHPGSEVIHVFLHVDSRCLYGLFCLK